MSITRFAYYFATSSAAAAATHNHGISDYLAPRPAPGAAAAGTHFRIALTTVVLLRALGCLSCCYPNFASIAEFSFFIISSPEFGK